MCCNDTLQAQEIMALAKELGVTCVSAYRLDATKACMPAPAVQQKLENAAACQDLDSAGAAVSGHQGRAGTVSRQHQELADAGGAQLQAASHVHAIEQGAAKVAARAQRKAAARTARGLAATRHHGRTPTAAPFAATPSLTATAPHSNTPQPNLGCFLHNSAGQSPADQQGLTARTVWRLQEHPQHCADQGPGVTSGPNDSEAAPTTHPTVSIGCKRPVPCPHTEHAAPQHSGLCDQEGETGGPTLEQGALQPALGFEPESFDRVSHRRLHFRFCFCLGNLCAPCILCAWEPSLCIQFSATTFCAPVLA